MNTHAEEVCQRWIQLVQKKERMKVERPREEKKEVSMFGWVCIVLMVVVALYVRKWGVCWRKGVFEGRMTGTGHREKGKPFALGLNCICRNRVDCNGGNYNCKGVSW